MSAPSPQARGAARSGDKRIPHVPSRGRSGLSDPRANAQARARRPRNREVSELRIGRSAARKARGNSKGRRNNAPLNFVCKKVRRTSNSGQGPQHTAPPSARTHRELQTCRTRVSRCGCNRGEPPSRTPRERRWSGAPRRSKSKQCHINALSAPYCGLV